MRAVVVVVLAGCPGPTRPEPIANTSPAEDPAADCEDEQEGPLYAPTVDYVISRNELAHRTLREHQGDFLRCWTERAIHDPNLGGHCTATFRVDKAGHAHGIRTRGFDPKIDRCICLRIAAIQFPTYAEGEVTVPFTFPSAQR